MRSVVKVMIAAVIISLVALAGSWMYQVKSQNEQRQMCFNLEKNILALRGKVSGSELAFDASDFNARCGDLVGPGNQLVVSGN